jgi:hypothetical protein
MNPAQPRFLHCATAHGGHAVDRLASQTEKDNLHGNHKPKRFFVINTWNKNNDF